MYLRYMELEKVSKQLKTLGNRTRLEVFRQLVRFGPAGAPVGVVQNALDLAGSTLTNHLQKLVLVGLAHQERKGTQMICTADFDAMQTMIEYLQEQCCAEIYKDGGE